MQERRRQALMVTISDVTMPLGPAVSTMSVAEAIAAAGHDVELLATRQDNRPPILDVRGVTICWTPNGRALRLPIAFDALLQLPATFAAIRKYRPELLYIRHSTFAALVAALGRLMRVPLIVAEHNSWQADERRHGSHRRWLAPMEDFLQAALGRLAHRNRVVIAENGATLEKRGVPRDRVFLQPNGTNIRHISPRERAESLERFKLSPTELHLGFVGTFAWWQALPDLLPELALIVKQYPNARLLLAGDGPARDEIVRRAVAYGLRDRVSLLGVVPFTELPSLLACFDLALLPTATGHFVGTGRSPMKLGDYAAAGRPILAARIAGFDAFEAQGALALYDPEQAGALANAVITLLGDPERRARMGQEARRLAVENLSWDVRIAPLIAP